MDLSSRQLTAALLPVLLAAPPPAAEELPPGVEQLIPRGRIAAVFEPRFVSAEEAEIADDAWVLGVEIDGRARAYSLNLLNRHEVVNDRIGERSFAAVWWPLANTAVVYDRRIGDRELHFEASGALLDASLVMRDRETDSWWSIMTSDAIGGELEGADLVELPYGEKTTWGRWHAAHPDTLVLSVDGSEHEEVNPYEDYFASGGTFRDLEIDDRRLEPKEPIYSFRLDGVPYAVPHRAFAGGRLFAPSEVGGRYLLLHRPTGAAIFESTRAFVLSPQLAARGDDPVALLTLVEAENPEGARAVAGFDTFWYTWIAVNPDTEILE